ncbi:hypothetical protein I5L51_14875 [Pseudomonas mendocina]|nr:hypothetical protein [Pseudomonas mendocina]MBH3340395.1 hypothetical protein [Pseudomonas mendocina]
MKNLKIYLSAFALSLAGVAVHANAASENHRGDSGLCFQLTPLAGKGANRAQAENGFSRTQLGMQLERVAEDGFSRTRLGMQVGAHAANGVSSTPGAYAQATSA